MGLGLVCRPPALVFHLWLSADSPAPPDPQVLSAPTLHLSHAQTPTLSVTPSATSPEKKPGAVPPPHQPYPRVDLGPIQVQLPPCALPLPCLRGRRSAVWLIPEVPCVCWSSWLCPGIEAKHKSLFQSCWPQRAPRRSPQCVESSPPNIWARGPLGLGLLCPLLDSRWGDRAISGRGWNSMAQAGHRAGGRPHQGPGQSDEWVPAPSEGPLCALLFFFLKSHPLQVCCSPRNWGQKQAAFQDTEVLLVNSR